MRAMLDQGHADRRQLANLVATKPPSRSALLLLELPAAPAARIRAVINDLIDLILGPQLTPRALVSGLPTLRSPLPLSAHQLRCLRPGLRSPLSARLRRIRRRRARARARILTRLRLQPPQPILMLLQPVRELEDELHTRLTP
jgi:hypothetical protein